MGKKTTTTISDQGWNTYMYGCGSPYYVQGQGTAPYNDQQMTQAGAQGATDAEKLDKMTRSRNALIIAFIVFVAGFAACFIAVFVISFPPPGLDTVYADVTGDITNQAFNENMNTVESTKNVMIVTFCTEIRTLITSATASATCDQKSGTVFSAGTVGTKGTMKLGFPMDGKSAAERFQLVKDTLVTNAAGNSDYNVEAAGIVMSTSGAGILNMIQLPALLMLLFIVHKLL